MVLAKWGGSVVWWVTIAPLTPPLYCFGSSLRRARDYRLHMPLSGDTSTQTSPLPYKVQILWNIKTNFRCSVQGWLRRLPPAWDLSASATPFSRSLCLSLSHTRMGKHGCWAEEAGVGRDARHTDTGSVLESCFTNPKSSCPCPFAYFAREMASKCVSGTFLFFRNRWGSGRGSLGSAFYYNRRRLHYTHVKEWGSCLIKQRNKMLIKAEFFT